uniref:Methyltransf_11 domain-containing protein n=2 Tax=Rhodnius prolixus TaxID=13249 RepID=T1HPJ7_RHOPR
MPLLPKSSFEFSKTEYWDAFFKERGKKEFEWYGEYPELSGLLHKYVKPKEKLLVVGCGNSKLSACLYDVGYRNIVNIDISNTVIKQMKSANQERMEMTFEVMDALDMKFESESFSVVLDKGTLDALMSDDKEESVERVSKYFNEIDRILRVGGRYIVISLMQQHIMLFLLKQFTSRAWMIRVCRCYDVETKLTNEQGFKPLPVFMVICTKFKKMGNSKSILELCTTVDSPATRLSNTDKIIESVIEAQQVAIVCAGLQKSGSAGREILLEVGKGDDEEAKYSINIVDRQKVIEGNGVVTSYAAFIIPQGRETEWAFGTPEGRQFLAGEAGVDRLAVVTLNRGHKFNSLEEVKAELSPIISDFSPVTNKKKIAFLSVGNDVGVRKEVYVGKSQISGPYIVEETVTDGAIVRRLYFLSAKNIIQSEAKIRKVKTRRGNERVFVDTSSLSCSHHAYMCVGACSTLEWNQEGQLLVIGLGGGSLCSYLKKCFQKSTITAVELDPDMLFVATDYFGLVEDKQMIVHIKDGLDFIKESHENGLKYDVVMFDVDNKNITTGLSCPPQAFVQQDILSKVKGLLTPKGVFILNLVCRDKNICREIYNTVEKTFDTVASVKLEDDLNEIVYCWPSKIGFEKTLTSASDKFRNIVQHKKLEEVEAVQLSRMMDLLNLGN